MCAMWVCDVMHRNKANQALNHGVRRLQLPLQGVNAVYTRTLNMLTTQEMNILNYSLPVRTLL